MPSSWKQSQNSPALNSASCSEAGRPRALPPTFTSCGKLELFALASLQLFKNHNQVVCRHVDCPRQLQIERPRLVCGLLQIADSPLGIRSSQLHVECLIARGRMLTS